MCDKENDAEAGVIRGVDFDSVDIVILFDLPSTVEDLLHLSGRTGRGDNAGGECVLFVKGIEEKDIGD